MRYGNTQELHGLIRRNPIDQKAGIMSGRISKLLIYGQNQMPETQINTGG